MLDAVFDGLTYLRSQGAPGLFSLFWFVILFELPRYMFSFLAAAIVCRPVKPFDLDRERVGKVSAVIAGHNEAAAVERCVHCLLEQSEPPDEIVVVSDGSTDRMTDKLADLLRAGLIQKAHATELRAGKAAAVNLGETLASGDILVNVDCDCTFDRHALKHIVRPFYDREVGAVCGNILVRNPEAGLFCEFQAIEYLITISLGKRAQDIIGQVSCASGAFSAFRMSALRDVGGLDAGGGEDLDLTLRLRNADWGIVFSGDAICYTDAPETLTALIRQRFRWERDAVRIRYRKHLEVINPFSSRFKVGELFHEFEFLLFNVLAAAALPIYLLWLFDFYGAMAPLILLGAQAGLFIMDIMVFAIAAYATPQQRSEVMVPYLLGYSLFYGNFMRLVRLVAYVQEWVLKASYSDPYVPEKVHRVRE
ncbi:MAG: glycosyltransferase family 2 protein [Rhodobacteraceae bacterium]|nr:glycosyltransferase family 2 protein [Paracoccaceae bacterium]